MNKRKTTDVYYSRFIYFSDFLLTKLQLYLTPEEAFWPILYASDWRWRLRYREQSNSPECIGNAIQKLCELGLIQHVIYFSRQLRVPNDVTLWQLFSSGNTDSIRYAYRRSTPEMRSTWRLCALTDASVAREVDASYLPAPIELLRVSNSRLLIYTLSQGGLVAPCLFLALQSQQWYLAELLISNFRDRLRHELEDIPLHDICFPADRRVVDYLTQLMSLSKLIVRSHPKIRLLVCLQKRICSHEILHDINLDVDSLPLLSYFFNCGQCLQYCCCLSFRGFESDALTALLNRVSDSKLTAFWLLLNKSIGVEARDKLLKYVSIQESISLYLHSNSEFQRYTQDMMLALPYTEEHLIYLASLSAPDSRWLLLLLLERIPIDTMAMFVSKHKLALPILIRV